MCGRKRVNVSLSDDLVLRKMDLSKPFNFTLLVPTKWHNCGQFGVGHASTRPTLPIA